MGAGLLINQTGEANQYTALDISLTFLSLHYSRKHLHFLTDRVWDGILAERLTDDYKDHQDEELLNFFGTSSEEIIERTKKEDAEYYQPRIDSLSSQNDYLKSLLIQHNIPFNLETENESD